MNKYKAVERTVCEHFGCEPEMIYTRSREEENVEVRRAYCWLAYNKGVASLMAIGRNMGFNHATVLNHARKFDDLVSINDEKVVRAKEGMERIYARHLRLERIEYLKSMITKCTEELEEYEAA